MMAQDPEFDPSAALSDLDKRVVRMNRELQAGMSAFVKAAAKLQAQKSAPHAKAGQKRCREGDSSTND